MCVILLALLGVRVAVSLIAVLLILVRWHLRDCCCHWSPGDVKHSEAVVGIQKDNAVEQQETLFLLFVSHHLHRYNSETTISPQSATVMSPVCIWNLHAKQTPKGGREIADVSPLSGVSGLSV